jgi:hypothetical protein
VVVGEQHPVLLSFVNAVIANQTKTITMSQLLAQMK